MEAGFFWWKRDGKSESGPFLKNKTNNFGWEEGALVGAQQTINTIQFKQNDITERNVGRDVNIQIIQIISLNFWVFSDDGTFLLP